MSKTKLIAATLVGSLLAAGAALAEDKKTIVVSIPAADHGWTAGVVYHANAAVLSLMAAILTGCCQIQPDRFSPRRWWREIVETRATIVHYLGIIAPLLMSQPTDEHERRHQVRFGIGAGIEP